MKLPNVMFKEIPNEVIEKIKNKMEFKIDTYEGHTALEAIWDKFLYQHLEWYKIGERVDILKIKDCDKYFVWYRHRILDEITALHAYHVELDNQNLEEVDIKKLNDLGISLCLALLPRSYDLRFMRNEKGIYLKEGLWSGWKFYYKNKRLTIDDILQK